MNLWYLLSLLPLLVISLTAVARLNDIGKHQRSWNWIVRRVGFLMSAVYAVMAIAMPFTESGRANPTTWVLCVAHWGWAMVWFTTPFQKPWWLYITGEHRKDEYSGVTTKVGRITSEMKALGAGFRTPVERRSGDDRRNSNNNEV